MKAHYKQGHFTLIELLVCIGIIAILMTILLPALKRAKSKSQEVLCKTNQKQVGYVFHLYADDYDGWGPIFCNSSSALDSWYGRKGVWPYLYPDRTVTLTTDFTKTVLNCPVDTGHPTWFYGRIYCINWGLTGAGGWKYDVARRFSQIPSPNEVLLHFESYGTGADQYWSPALPRAQWATWHHTGGVNCLYVDGHVQWMKPGDFPNLTGSGLFWLGK